MKYYITITKWALQCAANTSPVLPFCRWSLLTGFHFPHIQCIDIFVAFFRWHFNPWTVAYLVYCYRVKAIFYNICTVLFWRLCGLTNSPILNTLSPEADVYGAQKVLSNNGFRMANCFCCLSQNAMVCLTHCRQELQQKTFIFEAPRDYIIIDRHNFPKIFPFL